MLPLLKNSRSVTSIPADILMLLSAYSTPIRSGPHGEHELEKMERRALGAAYSRERNGHALLTTRKVGSSTRSARMVGSRTSCTGWPAGRRASLGCSPPRRSKTACSIGTSAWQIRSLKGSQTRRSCGSRRTAKSSCSAALSTCASGWC